MGYTQGKTLYDILKEIYKTYGYYVENVDSTTLPGMDGVVKMKEIMTRVRENPPTEIGGMKVLARARLPPRHPHRLRTGM